MSEVIFLNLNSLVSWFPTTQLKLTCSKLAIETLEKGVKYIQS